MKNKKKIIIISSIIAIIIGLCVWDIADPPVWWRFERQKDKRAILEYVKDTYPKSVKRAGGDEFPIQFMGPYFHSVMYFELDGFVFAVTAKHGEVLFDGFKSARIMSQFDSIIQDGFMKPNGIIAKIDYFFRDGYDTYPYTGYLGVTLTVCDPALTPQEVEWFYDFYKYWEANADYLENYHVKILVMENDQSKFYISYYKDTQFADEYEFYSAFKPGPEVL